MRNVLREFPKLIERLRPPLEIPARIEAFGKKLLPGFLQFWFSITGTVLGRLDAGLCIRIKPTSMFF